MPFNINGFLAKRYSSIVASFERDHMSEYPDSIPTIQNRLSSFLLNRFSNTNQPSAKAAILNVLARSLLVLGDVQGADYRINQLRNQYANSPYAVDILPILQLVAMAQRDSIKMNDAISLMQASNFSAEAMQLAYVLKASYHRYRLQSPFPKNPENGSPFAHSPSSGKISVKNYPNPFNPITLIEYVLPTGGHTTLRVYDVLGRELVTLVNEVQSSGIHSSVFDASRYASGLYFYVLTSPSGRSTGRMLLAR